MTGSCETPAARLAAIAGIAAILACAGPPAAAAGPASRAFGDWQGNCRADGYCALTLHAALPAAGGSARGDLLRVGRHAEATYWEISLHLLASRAAAGRPFSVSIDAGPARAFTPPDGVAPYGAGNAYYFTGKGAQGLLDRMVAGGRARFGFTDASGAEGVATFTLAGLAAGLMWIDTEQHRIGSERVAEAPPVGVFRADLPGAGWAAPALATLQ